MPLYRLKRLVVQESTSSKQKIQESLFAELDQLAEEGFNELLDASDDSKAVAVEAMIAYLKREYPTEYQNAIR
jgi:hypothetical protein